MARQRRLRSWSVETDQVQEVRDARRAWCAAACALLAVPPSDVEQWQRAAERCREALDAWESMLLPDARSGARLPGSDDDEPVWPAEP
jgi:hypothetical protein